MALDDDWVTVNEAVKLSGYNADHLRELIRDGKIDGHKFSIVWKVNRESLFSYLNKVQAQGEKRGPKPKN